VRSPSRQTIWCILETKSAALVAAVFVDFPKNKRNFLHKNKLDIVRQIQFLAGRRPMRSFSPAAVATTAMHVEVGAYVTNAAEFLLTLTKHQSVLSLTSID